MEAVLDQGSRRYTPGPAILKDRREGNFYQQAERLWELGFTKVYGLDTKVDFLRWLKPKVFDSFLKTDGAVIVLPISFGREFVTESITIGPDVTSWTDDIPSPDGPYLISLNRNRSGVQGSWLTANEGIWSTASDPFLSGKQGIWIITMGSKVGDEPLAVSWISGQWHIDLARNIGRGRESLMPRSQRLL